MLGRPPPRAHTPGRSPTSALIDRGVIPILDRSRSRLRIPREILPEALRQAGRQGLASPLATVRMETGGIMVEGRLDPVVAAMLNVIIDASLMLTIDVELEGDASATTIWATPHRAVVTTSLDPELVDIRPVRINRLPETLSDVIMLRPSDAVDRPPVIVSAELYDRTAGLWTRPDVARDQLLEAGTDDDETRLIIAFQARSTRRWDISSTWSIEQGQQMAQIHGLDTGANGLWRLEMTAEPAAAAQLTFTPQDSDDVLRALRLALPRRWVGTALTPRPPR